MASSAASKRLMRDMKQLEKQPIVGAGACPTDDILVWHANIDVCLTYADGNENKCPLHFVIVFKPDYPNSAPNAGFCTDFDYSYGASYMGRHERDGSHLEGKKILCLNVLGNFADVHDEWEKQQGSGWSPAYTVSTLLVSLQAVLLELNTRMSCVEKRKMYNAAMSYACEVVDGEFHRGETPYPQIAEEDAKEKKEAEADVPEPVLTPPPPTPPGGAQFSHMVMQATYAFAAQTKLAPSAINQLFELLKMAKDETSTLDVHITEAQQTAPQERVPPPVDETISCYMTCSNCSEDTLGYGIVIDHRMLKTSGEIISWEAFYTNGLRVTTMKTPFTHFLPAFLTPQHISQFDWKDRMQKSLISISKDLDGRTTAINVVLNVLPCLINSMVVEIMKNEKAGAISFFEALCSFWRTLRWYIETNPSIRATAIERLQKFVSNPKHRHKDIVPDIGQLLALSTTLSCDGDDVTYSSEAFVDAYLEENFTRCVMWWENKGARAEDVMSVFKHTEISRNICLFTLMVRQYVLGGDSSVKDAVTSMDATHGKVTQKLDCLQEKWRQYQQNPATTWHEFATQTKCSDEMVNRISSGTNWIADCVRQARVNGRKYGKGGKGNYGGGKGGGKGNYGGGKGNYGGGKGRYFVKGGF